MMQPTFAEIPPETSAPPAQATAPSAEEDNITTTNNNNNNDDDDNNAIANLSSPWEYDETQVYCAGCACEFSLLERKHHCRFCGKIFCGSCSDYKSLIPPSSIVLVPKGGKKVTTFQQQQHQQATFSPDPDPDRMLTYVGSEGQAVLYGKGLEERFTLARQPLRVCSTCNHQLASLQPELRHKNSNAMRYNPIDPTDSKRLLNSPLAFTLGHEVRKAAYTLNNLLPLPRRMGAFVSTDNHNNEFGTSSAGAAAADACKQACTASPTLADLDGVKIPARLMEEAKGVATLTIVKAGFGLIGGEFGTGLVVARLPNGQWSAPSAIGAAGVSWGALIGAQVSDHVFLLMTHDAVQMLFSNNGSVNLGADIGVALGPLGRALEGNVGASINNVAPIYTYSLSKGLYAGASLDGKVICTRHDVNERFYGQEVNPTDLYTGTIPTPPAAQPLYDALTRCHVYATSDSTSHNNNNMKHRQAMEYGEYNNNQHAATPQHLLSALEGLPATPMMPPADNDQHSYSYVRSVSDITSEPGYSLD